VAASGSASIDPPSTIFRREFNFAMDEAGVPDRRLFARTGRHAGI
jgi:hypothetical protein